MFEVDVVDEIHRFDAILTSFEVIVEEESMEMWLFPRKYVKTVRQSAREMFASPHFVLCLVVIFIENKKRAASMRSVVISLHSCCFLLLN